MTTSGSSPQYGNYFKGKIYQFEIYDSELSSTFIDTLYTTSGCPPTTYFCMAATLADFDYNTYIANWYLRGSPTQWLPDLGPNGYHLNNGYNSQWDY